MNRQGKSNLFKNSPKIKFHICLPFCTCMKLDTIQLSNFLFASLSSLKMFIFTVTKGKTILIGMATTVFFFLFCYFIYCSPSCFLFPLPVLQFYFLPPFELFFFFLSLLTWLLNPIPSTVVLLDFCVYCHLSFLFLLFRSSAVRLRSISCGHH